MAKACTVFISSTSEDLKEYRLAVRDAVLAVGLRPEMMEYFAATGGPPLAECLRRVSPCDVVVVLVAQRYGWVPPDQAGPEAKSITWLECGHAAGQGKELLVFFSEPSPPWPVERTEAYRLTAAFNEGKFTPELPSEIERNVAKLGEFRQWLETGRTRNKFTTPDDLRAKVIQALYEWLDRHPDYRPQRGTDDPRAYLEWLRERSAAIDIQGLGESAGKARNFPIEELYIPLTTAGERPDRVPDKTGAGERKPMRLEEALEHRRLVIVGDPGSGKTTFLRRITFAMAKAALEGEAGAKPATDLLAAFRPGSSTRPFPISIRIAELVDHMEQCSQHSNSKTCPEPDSPEWLCHFLATRNTSFGWGLSEDFFSEKLLGGEAVVLLDGLDEAPNRTQRERAARVFENSTHAYGKSRFAVTTRSQSSTGHTLLAGFHEARIEPLTPDAVHTFLDRWCRGLYPDSPSLAEEHRDELVEALRVRPEIRSMTRNPMMLTALAVVHWNERRLPEQRAELYDRILTWLSRQREKKPGRENPPRCLKILSELALAMHHIWQGRFVRITLEDSAKVLASEFGGPSPKERQARALDFLEQETADSGIIVSRGVELQFWHLTFQEYLAAQAIAGRVEAEQLRLLFDEDNIYRSEWREVALLLAGILHEQGRAKVDWLVSALLDRTGKTLADQARAVGLIGAMVADLKPLNYEPSDKRYRELMNAVLGIFDREKSKSVEFAVRLEAAEALGQAGDPRIGRNNWVRINGGTFLMGEAPGKEVTVATFEIGRYPVTVMEYRQFVEDGGYQEERWWKAGGFGQRNQPSRWEEQIQHPNRPVTWICWYEAAAYAAWSGVRLPREAEWEFAARGTEGREYAWGNQEPDATRANYREAGPGHPTPVGLYPAGATPEPGGLLDMAGNVWEWVDEWCDSTQELRMLRGGSYLLVEPSLRAVDRRRERPDMAVLSSGFRVTRGVSSP